MRMGGCAAQPSRRHSRQAAVMSGAGRPGLQRAQSAQGRRRVLIEGPLHSQLNWV